MTKQQAKQAALGNINAFRVADFRHMKGEGKRPDPLFYGISGTVNKPGNTIRIGGYTFSIDEIATPTAPIHAGF